MEHIEQLPAPGLTDEQGQPLDPAECGECGEVHQSEWNTAELQRDFEVEGFQAPYVVVKRRSDGQVGSLMFDHHPRRYYGWTPHEGGA